MSLLRDLRDLITPPRCPLCNRFLNPEATRDFICPDCRAEVGLPDKPSCTVCGRPFPVDVGGDHLCGDCRVDPPAYRAARYITPYFEPIDRAIKAFKFNSRFELGVPLSRLIGQFTPEPPLPDSFDGVLPVPLHKSRLRRRSFNQSAVLAAGLSDLGPVRTDLLARIKPTRPQIGLTLGERRANVKGAFRLTDPEAVKGGRFLLVDDVFTTGSTLNECARTLNRGGARDVFALTLARAI